MTTPPGSAPTPDATDPYPDFDEWDQVDSVACEWCGDPLSSAFGEVYGNLGPVLCRSCVGLDRCPDDMCHGAGYCMHSMEDAP